MGGWGSGRYGYTTTAKLDEGLRLDINKLKREGQVALHVWASGSLLWTRVSSGEQVASIGYEVNTTNPEDMWMRVHYTHTPYHSDEPEKMDYKIRLTTTQPNYGGKRLWFICPITGKRTSVLYSPSGSKWFASRYAYKLKYGSQSKGAQDRAIDRMWKLKNKLGGEEFYRRPKGMHKQTFERKLEEIWEAEEVADGYLAHYLLKFVNL